MRALAAALVVVSALAAAACRAQDDRRTTLERVRAAGVVRVGFANEAPYAYLDPETDRLTGEAPEIARVVLKDAGVAEVEGVLLEFGQLIPGLKARRIDVIAAGMYIPPERAKEVAFSNPTYGIGEAFLVRKRNPHGLHSYADVVAKEDVRLGVVSGTVELGYAGKLGIPEDRVVIFPDAQSAVAGLQADRVDVYAGTALTVNDLLRKAEDPGIERADPFTDPEIDGRTVRGYGAFAFRKEDEALRGAFDEGLAKFVGTDAHLALVAPFGFGPAEMPAGVTAADVIAGRR